MQAREKEPLPIWFFVGAILVVYGVIILGSGLLWPPATPPAESAALAPVRGPVLAYLRPALWWGGIMIFFGAVFVAIGLHVHRAAPTRADAPGEDEAGEP